MAFAQSKLTAQGQISVRMEVRRKLGIGPGSVVEWEEKDDAVIVRKAGRYKKSSLSLLSSPGRLRCSTHRTARGSFLGANSDGSSAAAAAALLAGCMTMRAKG